MSTLTKPIRFTAQKQQELVSRNQFQERLVGFGWKPTVPEDLGEDIIVDVYFQGRATGVNFYVQLKSVTNLNARRKGDDLVYAFKVKDLKHWETFELPVVLVVWDIELREGRWVLVGTVIAELDQRRPQWRNNKTKTRVRIPWNNTTDDAGLVRLRKSIGWRLYPLIVKDKPFDIEVGLSFPGTQEGRATQQAVDRWMKEGNQAIIKGEFVKKLEFPQWFMRWFGEFDLDEVTLMVDSQASSETLAVGVDFIGANGELTPFKSIELKRVKAGTEIVQLSNEHQISPLHFYFTIPKANKRQRRSISFKVNNLGRHAYEARDILKFLRAMGAGGRLRLTSLTYNNIWKEFEIPPQPEKLPVSTEDWQLVNKLCTIQDRTGHSLQIPIEGPTTQDVLAIDELIAIIEHGKTVRKHVEATVKFKGPALDIILDTARQGERTHLSVSYDESHVNLFDLEIQMGRMTRDTTGTFEISATELEQTIAALAPAEYLTVKLVDAQVVEIFPDWFAREAQRLSQCLVDNFGAESVYLFGSLAWSDVHAPETDIDLAVDGLPPERYLEAIGYLERESSFPVDLVDLNSVPNHLRQRILAEGRKLK
jgi:predicted nucleotidyltransferase